jgi:hypothetical protein
MVTHDIDYPGEEVTDKCSPGLDAKSCTLQIRGYVDQETGAMCVDKGRHSPFIVCFESGADARTHIAILSSIPSDSMHSIPDVTSTKALIETVNTLFPSINASLNTKFESFVKENIVMHREYDDIKDLWRRTKTSEQSFDAYIFLNRIYRTGPFPIDSKETLLLLAACAQASVALSSIEFAYRCVEAIFIHNNRRYDLSTQRQRQSRQAAA